jgi:LEA14-like dessication related protein
MIAEASPMAVTGRRWLVFAVLALLGACASVVGPVEEPRISITSIRFLPPSGAEQRIEVGLKLMNPNGFDLKASGIVLNAGFNEVPVLSGAIAEPPVVPAYGEQDMKMVLSASLMNGIRLLRSIMQHPEDPVSYRLDARIDLKLPLARTLRILKQGEIAAQAPAGSSSDAPATKL